MHATATTAELGAAGYLVRAAIPQVHRFETRQALEARLHRSIARNPRLTRIYEHAGRNLPAFLNASPIPQPWQTLAVGAGYTLEHSSMMSIGLGGFGLDPLSNGAVRLGVRLFMEDSLTLADPVLPDYSPAAPRFMPGTKMVYLGGLGNIFPRSLFLDEMHRLSGHKVVVVSTAKGRHRVQENDSHAIVGPYKHHSDSSWNRRVAMVVERLNEAIEAGHFDDPTIKRIIFWGHSMGGLLNFALGVIAQTARVDGVLPDRIYREFPGLSKVHLHKISAVANLVRRGKLVGVGDPLEGVPVPFWLRAVDYVATGGMHRPFKPTYLEKVYERTGFQPNQVLDLSIHTRLNGVRARPRSGNGDDSWMDYLGDTAFRGVSVVLNNDGDRVVPGRKGLFQARGIAVVDDLDHVDQIRSPVFLGKFLDILAQNFGDRP
ncbi:MAG: hypothetical protein HYU97_09240 [Deltaproteobacteria bacterium]|nr:hypothetical protein [Deltaproteobacteria bacterium]